MTNEKFCIYCNHKLNHTSTEMASEHNDVDEDYEIDYYRCPHCGRHYKIAAPMASEGFSTEPYIKKRTLTDEDIKTLKVVNDTLGEEARLAIIGECVSTEDDLSYFREGKDALDKLTEGIC